MLLQPFYEYARKSGTRDVVLGPDAADNVEYRERDSVMRAVRNWADRQPPAPEAAGISGPMGLQEADPRTNARYFSASDTSIDPILFRLDAVRPRAPGTLVQMQPGSFRVHPARPDIVKAVSHVSVARCSGLCGGVLAWLSDKDGKPAHRNYQQPALLARMKEWQTTIMNVESAKNPFDPHPLEPLDRLTSWTALPAQAAADSLGSLNAPSGDDFCVFEGVSGNGAPAAPTRLLDALRHGRTLAIALTRYLPLPRAIRAPCSAPRRPLRRALALRRRHRALSRPGAFQARRAVAVSAGA